MLINQKLFRTNVNSEKWLINHLSLFFFRNQPQKKHLHIGINRIQNLRHSVTIACRKELKSYQILRYHRVLHPSPVLLKTATSSFKLPCYIFCKLWIVYLKHWNFILGSVFSLWNLSYIIPPCFIVYQENLPVKIHRNFLSSHSHDSITSCKIKIAKYFRLTI